MVLMPLLWKVYVIILHTARAHNAQATFYALYCGRMMKLALTTMLAFGIQRTTPGAGVSGAGVESPAVLV